MRHEQLLTGSFRYTKQMYCSMDHSRATGVGDMGGVSGKIHRAGRSWLLGGMPSSSEPSIVSIGDGVRKDTVDCARGMGDMYSVRPLASITRRLAASVINGTVGTVGEGGVGSRWRDEMKTGDIGRLVDNTHGSHVYIRKPR